MQKENHKKMFSAYIIDVKLLILQAEFRKSDKHKTINEYEEKSFIDACPAVHGCAGAAADVVQQG